MRRTLFRIAIAFIVVALLSTSRAAFATGQISDEILYEMKDTFILECPLQKYLEQHKKQIPRSDGINSANWKGYKAGWEIRNSRLLLVRFEVGVKSEPTSIDVIIPGATLPVHADWYTGKLHVITGKRLTNSGFSHLNKYESIDVLDLEKGKVVKRRVWRNVNRNDIPELKDISRTFSIIAVDPETGICGAAVASKYPAVGKVVPSVRAGVGAFCTQHYHRPEWRDQAMEVLEKGTPPAAVLAELLANDDAPGERQLAIINAKGVTAVHNPTDAEKSSHYWGAMSGRFYSCQGNTLVRRKVITSMAKAYEETKGSIADRLMAALIAADNAGGDHRGRLAAGIRVAKPGVDGVWLELDVDESNDAVRDLARKYAELKHDAKGEWRGANLPFEYPDAPKAEQRPKDAAK
ncbi:MAG: DUF1028 domain-containing protein [Planctomycetaceae bacterium]